MSSLRQAGLHRFSSGAGGVETIRSGLVHAAGGHELERAGCHAVRVRGLRESRRAGAVPIRGATCRGAARGIRPSPRLRARAALAMSARRILAEQTQSPLRRRAVVPSGRSWSPSAIASMAGTNSGTMLEGSECFTRSRSIAEWPSLVRASAFPARRLRHRHPHDSCVALALGGSSAAALISAWRG